MSKKTEAWLAGGPKKQWNLRMPISLRNELAAFAKARGLQLSEAAMGLLLEAVANRCRRCRGGLTLGSTLLRPKPCRYCKGTGRLDHAKLDRKIAADLSKMHKSGHR